MVQRLVYLNAHTAVTNIIGWMAYTIDIDCL